MEGLFLTVFEKYGSPVAWLALVFLAVRMSSKITKYMDKIDSVVNSVKELGIAQSNHIATTDAKHSEQSRAISVVREEVAKIKGHIGINGIH